MIDVYIGLGSNLNEPVMQIKQALGELVHLPKTRLVKQSSLYTSQPMGPQDQPDYVNAAAWLQTQLEPLVLLDQLQSLETAHQRVRKHRWGPRTLDLDLLLYGDEIIDVPRLQVPHVGLPERNFVLYPLAEINPSLRLPKGTAIQDVIDKCPVANLQRINL